MKKPPKVLCNKFAECPLKACLHHTPHNKDRFKYDDYTCTQEGQCNTINEQVQCVKASLIA